MGGSFNAGGLLSMCRRAGRLSVGTDMVKGACRSREARGVYVASDISEKSLKEIKYVCLKNEVRLYRTAMTMDEIAASIGKRAGVVAICDAGFNKRASSCLEEIPLCGADPATDIY